jgi:ABC-type uncharacterized transport system ATPase component
MADRFVDIDELHIDLIDSVNPFQKAYEILSKDVTPKVLKVIQDAIEVTKIQMTVEEALTLYPNKVREFMKKNNGKQPNINSSNLLEKRMAEAIVFLSSLKQKK